MLFLTRLILVFFLLFIFLINLDVIINVVLLNCCVFSRKKTVNDNFFGKQVQQQQQFMSLDRGLLNTGLFAIQSENPMDLLPVSVVCLLPVSSLKK